jgi:FAD/FMN-containing dehydrogenase
MFEAIQLWAGCADLTVPQCREPNDGPDGQLSRVGFTAKSDFFTGPLPADGIAGAMTWIERRQRRPELTGAGAAFAPGALQFDSFGGALNRPAPDATAFVHRDAFSHGQYLAYWAPGASPDAVEANLDWIRSFHGAMRPWASGSAYQNYIDPDLADWERAYYGANLGRLRAVKRAYDPDELFRFPQGIRPA